VLLARTGPDRHDPDWAELVIGTYCLGGALTSRLGLVLREEKGYTYGIHAYPNVLRSNAEGTGGALLGIQCSVETKVTGDALADIFTVLRELTTRPLNDAERDAAVQYLVGVAPMRYETAAAVADTFADQWEQGLPEDYQARQYERLARVVTERASDAVVRAFPPERLVVVLVGDAAKITDSVRALDIGPVEVRA
jgi:predicted Zn-dependent peptidase